MISASQAKRIAAESDAAANRAMGEIEKKILEAAEKGETKVALYVDKLWEAKEYQPDVTVLQQRVIDKLKAAGFGAKVEPHGDAYIPRELQNDYGDATGPLYQNYCIIARW